MSPPRIALATAIAAFGHDQDLAPLVEALAARGAAVEVLAWDDPSVSWARFELVVLRSTWDYMDRLDAFLAWCDRVHAASTLLNAPDVVRWNTDKHYLAELAAAGVPVPGCRFLEPSADATLPASGGSASYARQAAQSRVRRAPTRDGEGGVVAEASRVRRAPTAAWEAELAAALEAFGECVVKPAVGAGSRGAQRFGPGEHAAAEAHAAALLAEGRSVLVQPYLTEVDEAGETDLVFLGGRFSHAIRKGPLLAPGIAASTAMSAPSRIEPRVPSAAELEVARHVLAALPFGHPPAYARVDLLPTAGGPQLLEIELTEPSLYFQHGPGSAERFAQVLMASLASRAPPPAPVAAP